MARMTGFIFQDKYLKRLAKLSDQEVGRLVRALATYHATGEEQELKGRECGYYDFIKGDIDENEQAYQKKCNNMKREQLPATAPNCTQLPATAPICTQLPATADNINIKDKDVLKETPLKGSKEKRERFSPPSVEEVDAYCKERGNKINAQTFVDFYASKGWRVGNNPMKDWKACVRTWEQRDNSQAGSSQKPRLLRAQDYKQREYNEAEMEEALGVRELFEMPEAEFQAKYGKAAK